MPRAALSLGILFCYAPIAILGGTVDTVALGRVARLLCNSVMLTSVYLRPSQNVTCNYIVCSQPPLLGCEYCRGLYLLADGSGSNKKPIVSASLRPLLQIDTYHGSQSWR